MQASGKTLWTQGWFHGIYCNVLYINEHALLCTTRAIASTSNKTLTTPIIYTPP